MLFSKGLDSHKNKFFVSSSDRFLIFEIVSICQLISKGMYRLLQGARAHVVFETAVCVNLEC
jgi:hypothetical protein